MKVTYNSKMDILNIQFSTAPIEESDEAKPGIIIDYDKKGNITGIEILEASKRIENPKSMEYAVSNP